VAKGACLSLVPLDEAVTFDQTNVYSADDRTLHVAIPTGRMAAPAGFLKDLLVKDLSFPIRKPAHHSMPETSCRIVKRGFVNLNNLFVTGSACRQVVGGSLDETLMSCCSIGNRFVSLMTRCTSF
jgi:hypothetical protein